MRKAEPLYEDPWYLIPDLIKEEADLQEHLAKQALLDQNLVKANSHIVLIQKLTALLEAYNDYNKSSRATIKK